MLHIMPRFARGFVPSPDLDLETLVGRIHWRGRASIHALEPAVYNDDPLVDPCADSQPVPQAPKRKSSPSKKKDPARKQTLPTPTDVPAPTPTDVPVPEPWDVPPPDPGDPRPKSIP